MIATPTQRSGARHIEHCMGTVFTIEIRDPGRWDDAVVEVVTWLHRVDALFSTYRACSDISRIRNGYLTVARADPLVREVMDLGDRYALETSGYFTTDLPGGMDPTGLVKGWAIERASDMLRIRGSANHAINGGGDMQLAGEAAPGQPWRVGVIDPFDRTRIMTVVSGCDIAVATSGVAERGAHVVDPRTSLAVVELASVTVVGSSCTTVDVHATAAFAMGAGASAWLEALPSHEGIVVARDGVVVRTAGMP